MIDSQRKLVWFILSVFIDTSWATTVEQHLQLGTQMLRAGNLGEALNHYHAAVEGNSRSYMAYFQRATVYLALGRHRQALSDLESVISIKPDFHHARSEKIGVLIKQGDVEGAKVQLEQLMKHDIDKAQDHLRNIPVLVQAVEAGDSFFDNSDYANAIDSYDKAIEIAKWDTKLREKRSECYLNLGNVINAIGDIRAIAKLTNDNTGAFLKLSKLHYLMGEEEESLKEIRECLKLDQDHKECHAHYKKVKKLAKLMNGAQDLINEGDYNGAISKLHAALKTEESEEKIVLKIYSRLCLANKQASESDACIDTCSKVLARDSRDIEAITNRAECHIQKEDYEAGVLDYKEAVNINPDNRATKEGLTRAEKLLKISKRRDYYKILGVPRNANKQQINKAYRKLARELHPDKFTDEVEKAEAEKKFIDLAAAKEVLTDDEKRQQFDNGDDPLDPETEQGRNFHQHFHGFPFGGDGQQFFFKFG